MIVSNELKKIFGIEYYNAIANYIAMIQSIIDNYDIAINRIQSCEQALKEAKKQTNNEFVIKNY